MGDFRVSYDRLFGEGGKEFYYKQTTGVERLEGILWKRKLPVPETTNYERLDAESTVKPSNTIDRPKLGRPGKTSNETKPRQRIISPCAPPPHLTKPSLPPQF